MLDSWIDHNGHDDITATSMMVTVIYRESCPNAWLNYLGG